MPTELTGKLTDLHIFINHAEGRLGVNSQVPVKFGEKTEFMNSIIEVPFITESQKAIDTIRKADGGLKLFGRFFGTDGALIFEVKSAEEVIGA